MGFCSFRGKQVPDDDLRDALFAAAAASDIRALKKLASLISSQDALVAAQADVNAGKYASPIRCGES